MPKYHRAPQRYRDSIQQHGIDYRKGEPQYAEQDWPRGNYVSDSPEGYANWYGEPEDTWEIDSDGIDWRDDPANSAWQEPPGWSYTKKRIPPERIRLHKQAMAMTPEQWSQVLADTPYFFHVTSADRSWEIRQQGILPHDAPEVGGSRNDGDFFQTRPGHVYMWTSIEKALNAPWFLDQNGEEEEAPVVCVIDAKQLDPNLVNADEDYAYGLHDTDMSNGEWAGSAEYYQEKYPGQTQEDPSMADFNSLGEWSNAAPSVNSPEVTWDSYNPWGHGAVAYNGSIPPSAIISIQYYEDFGADSNPWPFTASVEPLPFERLAAFILQAEWSDVMAKAKRLVLNGAVTILNNTPSHIMATVIGEGTDNDGEPDLHHVEISRDDVNSGALTQTVCDCAWQQYRWDRTRQWAGMEGRVCSHIMATYWKARSTPIDTTDHPNYQVPVGQRGPAQQQIPLGIQPMKPESPIQEPSAEQQTLGLPSTKDLITPAMPNNPFTVPQRVKPGEENVGQPNPNVPQREQFRLFDVAPFAVPQVQSPVSMPGATPPNPANPVNLPGTFSKTAGDEPSWFEGELWGNLSALVDEATGDFFIGYVGDHHDDVLDQALAASTEAPEKLNALRQANINYALDPTTKSVSTLVVLDVNSPEMIPQIEAQARIVLLKWMDDAEAGGYAAFRQSKTAMAERSGDPELDALIEGFMKGGYNWEGASAGDSGWREDPTYDKQEGWSPVEGLRNPGESENMCDIISGAFVAYVRANSAMSVELVEMEDEPAQLDTDKWTYSPMEQYNYQDRGPGWSYHAIVKITTQTGEYTVDFSATQYGYTEFPMVQKKSDEGWSRNWTSRAAKMTRPQLLRARDSLDRQLGPDQAEVVYSFPDGSTIRKIVTPEDFHREGVLMRNCWQSPRNNPQDPANMEAQESKEYGAYPYSVRDRDNLPLASFLVSRDGEIINVWGTRNRPATPAVQQYLREWSDSIGLTYTWQHQPAHMDFARTEVDDPAKFFSGQPTHMMVMQHYPESWPNTKPYETDDPERFYEVTYDPNHQGDWTFDSMGQYWRDTSNRYYEQRRKEWEQKAIPIIPVKTSEWIVFSNDALVEYLNNQRTIGAPAYVYLTKPVTLELKGGKIPTPGAMPYDVSSEGVPMYAVMGLGWNPQTQMREKATDNEVGGAPEWTGQYATAPANKRAEVIDWDEGMKWAYINVPLNYPGGEDARLHPHSLAGWVNFSEIAPLEGMGKTPFRRS